MIKQILSCFILAVILNITYLSHANTLFHWDFDGHEGETLISALDAVSDANLVIFGNSEIFQQISYSKSNPWFNTTGTSVEFLNDHVYKDVGNALAVVDTGENTDLDLSTYEAFTIEFFLCPYGLNNCVLVGKGESGSGYWIELSFDGKVRFKINADENVISTGTGIVQRGKWNHIAAVFDKADNSTPMKLFVDEILCASGGNNTQARDSANSFAVGTKIDNNYNPPRSSGYNMFSGKLDELRISDAALSPDDFLINAVKTKALYPYPENHAEQFSRTTHLTWQPASGVSRQRIYFGLNPDNLDFIAEAGPEINTMSNLQLGGKLQQGTTYYWRVDSQGEINQNTTYNYTGEGRGQTWSFTTQDNIIHDGYLKWLLHLGQSPYDMVSAAGNAQLEHFGGDPNVRPTVGEIYDFRETFCRASHDLMIWTPQYSSTGFFEGYGFDDFGIQYYHIYIHSPEDRDVRLNTWHFGNMSVWCNGDKVLDSAGRQKQWCDLTLQKGCNSILFKVGVETNYGMGYDPQSYYLSVRFTDSNDIPITGLTYSLEVPTPEQDMYVHRKLPHEYDPNQNINVTLEIDVIQDMEQYEASIIELIPNGTQVVNSGGGYVTGNSIQWLYPINNNNQEEISYSLSITDQHTEPIAFIGYVYKQKQFEEIKGENILFDEPQISPVDIAEQIDTIEIYPDEYKESHGVIIGGEFASDYSGSLENYGRGLVSGLKADQNGGWAEYELNVIHPGQYNIILEYGELWTMFHQRADVNIIIDNEITCHAQLYPTTHCYGCCYSGGSTVYGPDLDPDRKAKCIVGVTQLSSGKHTLSISFPQMYPEDKTLDRFTDGRPVITRITLTNYPGLSIPESAIEPHHLDSYEHPPARLVHDRDIVELPDGTTEMTFYGTFYSLSQGNELYFADGYVKPRSDLNNPKFEIVSITPDVFYLPPDGEQDFTLVVRSNDAISEDYSEMVVVLLKGVPSNPVQHPYLFTTANHYVSLSPYEPCAFEWNCSPLLDFLYGETWFVSQDITDSAELFIPSRYDLGLEKGRYILNVDQFFENQFREGKLSSTQKIFDHIGWDSEYHEVSWGRIWTALLASTYHCNNAQQGKEYIQRLSENMVFYPVLRRWDWANPEYLPQFAGADFVRGMPALASHIRTVQENMISDEEQFRILHNMILPIYKSYIDELRTFAFLAEDVKQGDTKLFIDRPNYGTTGTLVDGFSMNLPGYVKIEEVPYPLKTGTCDNYIILKEPLKKAYPKGTMITSWAFTEGVELEARNVTSLAVLAAASRDPAVIDESVHMMSEIFDKHRIFLDDGSFRNEPGSYGSMSLYPGSLLQISRLLGNEWLKYFSSTTMNKIHNAILNISKFPFSNGKVPHLNGGGCMNQLDRSWFKETYMLDELFPDDIENIELYKHIAEQEKNRLPGDIIDNNNFVVHGWGYAMLRNENGSWDRGMETLLSSKHLLSDPGDHVSSDSLGLVLYGLGAILTPRYGYSWIGYAAPLLNQVMVDNDLWDNTYYGSFWHFDGRNELPSAVAHTGDGADSSLLNRDMSRWCIQFPEYLFDAYFVKAKDPNLHQFDWCFINMGELHVMEPQDILWQDCPQFMADYWPTGEGAGTKSISSKGLGRIVADWIVSNATWEPGGDPTLLRESPLHSGRLRLIMADDGPSQLINAQIGYYSQWNGEQTLANSQDVLAIRKFGTARTFVDTLETIADDEEAYVIDIEVIDKGNHNQQLIKVTTSEGEDWVYLSGEWDFRPDGAHPVTGVFTDADIVTWRIVDNVIKRVYIANGSYIDTVYGSWNFGTIGNHYIEH